MSPRNGVGRYVKIFVANLLLAAFAAPPIGITLTQALREREFWLARLGVEELIFMLVYASSFLSVVAILHTSMLTVGLRTMMKLRSFVAAWSRIVSAALAVGFLFLVTSPNWDYALNDFMMASAGAYGLLARLPPHLREDNMATSTESAVSPKRNDPRDTDMGAQARLNRVRLLLLLVGLAIVVILLAGMITTRVAPASGETVSASVQDSASEVASSDQQSSLEVYERMGLAVAGSLALLFFATRPADLRRPVPVGILRFGTQALVGGLLATLMLAPAWLVWSAGAMGELLASLVFGVAFSLTGRAARSWLLQVQGEAPESP